MIEAEARQWIVDRFGVSRETALDRFVELVRDEASRQNLVASSTLDQLWARHIVDSAQLLNLVPAFDTWLDIGTGAGFPGIVIGLLIDARVVCCEPRARRVDFLNRAIDALGIADRVSVAPSKVQAVTASGFDVISARAVAALPDLFAQAKHCAHTDTVWLLPKGRSAREEVARARKAWHGSFHVERSVTDPDALIVVAKGISPR